MVTLSDRQFLLFDRAELFRLLLPLRVLATGLSNFFVPFTTGSITAFSVFFATLFTFFATVMGMFLVHGCPHSSYRRRPCNHIANGQGTRSNLSLAYWLEPLLVRSLPFFSGGATASTAPCTAPMAAPVSALLTTSFTLVFTFDVDLLSPFFVLAEVRP